jgi:hypothetical protein
MKIIISCCDRKNGEPFSHNGEIIHFVSRVNEALPNNELYFHPDNLIPNEHISWRELVTQQENRNDLLPAYQLYRPNIYNLLFQNFGNDLFIFSAGWGIVRADFRLPKYNVTFSNNNHIPPYAKRNNDDIFHDFNHLVGIHENESIVLIAGSDYVLPFCQLTENLPNNKIIFYKNQNRLNNNPYLNGNNFQFQFYHTNRRTNWHYEFAQRLINNEIEI